MLGEMFTLVRSEALLEQRLKSIAHKLSDAGLQQMPDFNQRIAVLRRMGYIANDNTVQIKVGFLPVLSQAYRGMMRVLCEGHAALFIRATKAGPPIRRLSLCL